MKLLLEWYLSYLNLFAKSKDNSLQSLHHWHHLHIHITQILNCKEISLNLYSPCAFSYRKCLEFFRQPSLEIKPLYFFILLEWEFSRKESSRAYTTKLSNLKSWKYSNHSPELCIKPHVLNLYTTIIIQWLFHQS